MPFSEASTNICLATMRVQSPAVCCLLVQLRHAYLSWRPSTKDAEALSTGSAVVFSTLSSAQWPGQARPGSCTVHHVLVVWLQDSTGKLSCCCLELDRAQLPQQVCNCLIKIYRVVPSVITRVDVAVRLQRKEQPPMVNPSQLHRPLCPCLAAPMQRPQAQLPTSSAGAQLRLAPVTKQHQTSHCLELQAAVWVQVKAVVLRQQQQPPPQPLSLVSTMVQAAQLELGQALPLHSPLVAGLVQQVSLQKVCYFVVCTGLHVHKLARTVILMLP